MEFAWCEFRKVREGNSKFVKSIHRLKLFPQADEGKVKFNWSEPGGRWTYDAGCKLMYIEFNGCRNVDEPVRRHALRDRGDGSFQLIPYEDEIYRTEGLWSSNSVPHYNDSNCHIVMQKLTFPDGVDSK